MTRPQQPSQQPSQQQFGSKPQQQFGSKPVPESALRVEGGKRVEEAIRKCVRSMVDSEGIDPDEAKSRCIGRFKNTGQLKKKGRGLKESKRKGKQFKIGKDRDKKDRDKKAD